jgi:hypothetical protein
MFYKTLWRIRKYFHVVFSFIYLFDDKFVVQKLAIFYFCVGESSLCVRTGFACLTSGSIGMFPIYTVVDLLIA